MGSRRSRYILNIVQCSILYWGSDKLGVQTMETWVQMTRAVIFAQLHLLCRAVVTQKLDNHLEIHGNDIINIFCFQINNNNIQQAQSIRSHDSLSGYACDKGAASKLRVF